MGPVDWNEIPEDLQQRVLTQGVAAIGDLASWAYENRPASSGGDDLHDLLCALIVFLIRGADSEGRRIRSLPAILTTIAYRQRCQRFRETSCEKRAHPPWALSEDEPTPFAHLARLELCASIQRALGGLSALEREAIVRKHVRDESYREIAKAVFGPAAGEREEGRISVLLTRARRKLRDLLRAERA
jgi:DNA-directed RNA polymerase specialized sigma24 family protein